ncbi:hypothetical protein N2152v2_001248 [Parachlorella kessleri]
MSHRAAVVSVAGCENGRPKPANQDSFLTHAVHPCSAAILGVMDGHGRQGHVASARVRDAMLSALEPCARQAFTANKQSPRAADQSCGSQGDQDPPEPPSPRATFGNLGTSTALSASMAAELTPDSAQACLGATFSQAADAMRAAAAEFMHSGTTAVLCMVLPDSIVAAWAGDSRAVLGVAEPDGQGYKAQDLTKDHKPNNLTEMARIVAAGGRVSRTAKDRDGNPIGPFRVYLPTGRSPGLSVARAFGDTLLSSVGVVPHPDFAVFRLPQQPPSPPAPAAAAGASASEASPLKPSHILIVATDGLWEFVSSEEAVEIAASAGSPEQAAQLLGEAARQAWQAAWGGLHIDDVTIAVAFL